ncbi:hypothetical protein MJM99_30950, partial [Salmonella enterica subsp. enterica serovar Kentucky]|nr:hypothetical protein [Salmonella enterica subsp. enterica serovar Kentucky]
NYRSSGRILKAANILIANNPHVFEKRLFSELGYGAELKVLSAIFFQPFFQSFLQTNLSSLPFPFSAIRCADPLYQRHQSLLSVRD